MKKGFTLTNLFLSIANMLIGAIDHNWTAMFGWIVASLWIIRAIVQNEDE